MSGYRPVLPGSNPGNGALYVLLFNQLLTCIRCAFVISDGLGHSKMNICFGFIVDIHASTVFCTNCFVSTSPLLLIEY